MRNIIYSLDIMKLADTTQMHRLDTVISADYKEKETMSGNWKFEVWRLKCG